MVLSHGVGGGSGGEVGGATGAHLQGWRWERANMHTRTKHAARQLVASDTLVTVAVDVVVLMLVETKARSGSGRRGDNSTGGDDGDGG